MSTSYSDIGKNTSGLFTKGYNAKGLFKVSTKSKGDVEFTANAARDGKNNLSSGFESKATLKIQDITAVPYLKFDSKKAVVVGSELKNLFVNGLNVDLNVEQGGADKLVVKDSIKYSNENLAASLGGSFSTNEQTPYTVGADVSVNVEPFVVGADVAVAVKKDADNSISWGLRAYSASLFGALFQVSGKDNQKQILISGAVAEKINDDLTVGVSGQVDTKNVSGPSGALACEYKFDKSTSLKTKASFQGFPEGEKSSEIRVAFGLTQKLSSGVTSVLTADLNARQAFEESSNIPHSFGFELQFE
eukprot:TRINITY_DN10636_c0_g1_i1.p1 TRINITY_DN10636_c0_g1~~TRINITY_DN10636_c0_g1_i1.p1  ORF type:complete len:325 (-),score=119.30 TRINITY_DN10636_c0_g1_i1:119-1030(-)